MTKKSVFVKFDAFGTSTRGRKIAIIIFSLLYLSAHWGDLIKQIKKKICHIHFRAKLMYLTSICTVSVALICSSSFNRFPSDALTSSSSLLPLDEQINWLLKQTRNNGYDSKLHGNDSFRWLPVRRQFLMNNTTKLYVLKTDAFQKFFTLLKRTRRFLEMSRDLRQLRASPETIGNYSFFRRLWWNWICWPISRGSFELEK